MKNCDNCNYGSYGLDCNTGIETLYCREGEYEHEVLPNEVCDMHQFIDGYKNELLEQSDGILNIQKILMKKNKEIKCN